jgi:hypothetical protein
METSLYTNSQLFNSVKQFNNVKFILMSNFDFAIRH